MRGIMVISLLRFFVEIVIFIVFQRKAVFSEFIEIGYILYNHFGCGIRLFFYNAFYCVDMSVVDMCVRYDVYKLACLKSRRFANIIRSAAYWHTFQLFAVSISCER